MIPVQVDDLGPENAPGTLPSVQWIDYRKRSQEALPSLVNAFNRASPDPLPYPLPDAPEAPPPPRPGNKWWQRPKFRLLGAGAAVLVALVAVVLVAVAIWPDSGGDTDVSIPADRAWTDTGMEVGVGDVVTVRSSGEIVHDTALPNPVGPDGDVESELRQCNVIVDVNHAALIGRVGDEGVPFLVGASSQFTADHSGILYLGINDVGVQNNTGSFTSVITITPP